MFFLYKILATLNLAEKLNKDYPEHNFLPMFWMATEDHDFEEINSVSVFDKTRQWNTDQGGAVGRFLIDENFITIINQIAGDVKASSFGHEIIEIIESSYKLGDSLSICTRRFVSKLINDSNLIIVDGDDEQLKKEFNKIAQKEATDLITKKAVSETDTYLKNVGFHSQVHVRDINLFYLS